MVHVIQLNLLRSSPTVAEGDILSLILDLRFLDLDWSRKPTSTKIKAHINDSAWQERDSSAATILMSL
jgi:hypothetical protein